MKNKLKINLNRSISDVDFSQSFWSLIKISVNMLMYSSTFICTIWVTLNLISIFYPHKPPIKMETIHLFILLVAIVVCVLLLILLIPMWLREFNQRKDFRKALGNSLYKAKWKEKYLCEQEIILFYLLNAKAHNLLSNDEFEVKKDLFVKNNPVIYGHEFIDIVELKKDLHLTNEQFAEVKNNFINNKYSIAKKAELYALLEYNILTEAEIKIKLDQLKNSTSTELIVLKITSVGVLFGGFFYALCWISK